MPDCVELKTNTNRYLQVVGLPEKYQEPEDSKFIFSIEGQRVNISVAVHLCYGGRKAAAITYKQEGQFCPRKILVRSRSICPEAVLSFGFPTAA